MNVSDLKTDDDLKFKLDNLKERIKRLLSQKVKT